jgi:predicted dehydrogenase
MYLLLGHGYWGKNIAKTFNEDLYAVCDSNPNVISEVSTKYPHVKTYDNLDIALSDENIKAVIVATKASTHFELAKRVIETGRHVWIEKPAAVSLEHIDELIRLSELHKVRIFIDHIMCHDSTIRHIKEHIDIGTPLYLESYRLHQGLFQPDVNVIYDLAVHDLSIIDFLFPGMNLVSKEVIENRHVNTLADHAVLNLKFDNGFRATVTCSWVSPIKQRQMFISGSKSFVHYLDGNISKIDMNNELNESYSQDSCRPNKSIQILQEPGLKVAKDRFKSGILNGSDMITDIYQAKRIQRWLE